MPRPQLYPEDAIMDAARAVVLERGARGATIGAIADASGAPTGSIYHRFASVDELLARLWMRAMRRVQAVMLAAAEPVDTALAVYDFCLREREDALLLSSFRLDDFALADLPADARAQLEQLNQEINPMIDALATKFGGPAARDTVLLVVRDLPYGAALPHLRAGTIPPPQRRARLEAAVRAALSAR
ncbi:MAG TPA: helix-turn-helix domain-containing protein [Solirubrobacteraceae bacterium]|jgi:AcrR family transcriptional regulator|nr:helix-turn-helix domain-containing protein [Solirubrobacteraceae bacterium]